MSAADAQQIDRMLNFGTLHQVRDTFFPDCLFQFMQTAEYRHAGNLLADVPRLSRMATELENRLAIIQ